MSTIIIFARAPELGAVKTRLAKTIGGEQALALYEAFLDDTCALTQGLGARRVLCVAGRVDHPRIEHLAKSQRLIVEEQGDGDLGARMSSAIDRHIAQGPVVIIGSDAPTLPRAYLHQALDELMAQEVVIGPSEDGGYYLIGARLPVPELFVDVHWSTAEVLPTTLQRLTGRSSLVLPPWHDIDSAEDLVRLRTELATLPSSVASATRRVLGSMS
jgi:uncharacterized protein